MRTHEQKRKRYEESRKKLVNIKQRKNKEEVLRRRIRRN